MTTSTDQLLAAWRNAKSEADEAHRRALADADKIYALWQEAQRDAAVRGATLPTATWEDRLAALQALADASLHMRKPGDWYVSLASTSISDGHMLTSGLGNGSTPERAVEDLWQRYTNLGDGECIAVGYSPDRINAVWDDGAWKTWTPERVDA